MYEILERGYLDNVTLGRINWGIFAQPLEKVE